MKQSGRIAFFSNDEIELRVFHKKTELLRLSVYDKNDADYFDSADVYVNEKHENRLRAAAQAFNDAWNNYKEEQ